MSRGKQEWGLTIRTDDIQACVTMVMNNVIAVVMVMDDVRGSSGSSEEPIVRYLGSSEGTFTLLAFMRLLDKVVYRLYMLLR